MNLESSLNLPISPRLLSVFIAFALPIACQTVAPMVTPSPPSAAPPTGGPAFDVAVHWDTAYRDPTLELLGPDGKVLWSQRFDSAREGSTAVEIPPQRWFSGAGRYVLRATCRRQEGSVETQSAPLDLGGRESGIEGSVTFFKLHPSPRFALNVVVPAPQALIVEATAPPSREGAGSYAIRNGGAETFLPRSGVDIEHWNGGVWERAKVQDPFCFQDDDPESLPPGGAYTVDMSSTQCLVEPLPPGRYRHRLLFDVEAVAKPTRDAPVSVSRAVAVTNEFTVTEMMPSLRPHLFPTTNVEDIRKTAEVRGGMYTTAMLRVPDGGTGCACPGVLVGVEKRTAVAGDHGLCLTDAPDALPLKCDPILRSVSDHGMSESRKHSYGNEDN